MSTRDETTQRTGPALEQSLARLACQCNELWLFQHLLDEAVLQAVVPLDRATSAHHGEPEERFQALLHLASVLRSIRRRSSLDEYEQVVGDLAGSAAERWRRARLEAARGTREARQR